MHNSLNKYLQDAYAAVLVDICELYPCLTSELARDKKRLLSAIDVHGIYFCAVTLPKYGKVFDIALGSGLLPRTQLTHMRPWKLGTTIPRLFRGLLLKVFDSSGVLLSDPDIQVISFLRQLYRLAKKLELPCKLTDNWKTVNEFFKIDNECRSPSLDWDADYIGDISCDNLSLDDYADECQPTEPLLCGEAESGSSVDRRLTSCIQFAADVMSASIGKFKPTDWRPKHGPGAVADLAGCESKYDFPHWPTKLESVFSFADVALANYSMIANLTSVDGSYLHEPPSKLICVPKTLDKPRLIASEPISHQWCQQIILRFLADRIRHTYLGKIIHLNDQTKNGRLALLASQNGTHATIDLSSASDRISTHLVERVFRRNVSLLEAFHAVRTRWIRNDIDKKSPKFHKLKKFSTMGSALTFPCQSLIFSAVAIGCGLYARNLQLSQKNIVKLAKEVLVYGDDIIVPVDYWVTVTETLEAFGLKVNREKTFGTGKFRESCGCDAYDGVDITPASIITTRFGTDPESLQSMVDSHHNLFNKGLWAVANVVKRACVRKDIPDVSIGSGYLGWYHDNVSPLKRLKSRFNKDLHYLEVRVPTISSRAPRIPIRGEAMLLQYFTEACTSKFVYKDRLGKTSRDKARLALSWAPAINYLFSNK